MDSGIPELNTSLIISPFFSACSPVSPKYVVTFFVAFSACTAKAERAVPAPASGTVTFFVNVLPTVPIALDSPLSFCEKVDDFDLNESKSFNADLKPLVNLDVSSSR